MKSVYCLNPISNAGMSRFDDTYCIADSIENADAVLLRSASMHEMTLPDSLLAIGRAGAGVNNIPLDSCAKKGIVVYTRCKCRWCKGTRYCRTHACFT